jgi:hypothetical protein
MAEFDGSYVFYSFSIRSFEQESIAHGLAKRSSSSSKEHFGVFAPLF